MYAGLEGGTEAWTYMTPDVFVNLLTHPVDVSFALKKIHPLQAGYGMGDTYYYLERLDKQWQKSPKRREYVDLFLATGIAYGHLGWLIMPEEFPDSEAFAIEAMARSYYMMQQLQQQYAFVLPKTIEYADRNGKFLTPTQAHATGVINDSRLHVVYENGTGVYVNRSTQGVWTVRDPNGTAVELPVTGWLAFNPKNDFYEISANVSGRRIDYVRAPEYEFLDGRGQWVEYGNLGATGSVALRQRSGGALELIDMYGNDRIAFQAKTVDVLTAYDPDDKNLGKVELTSPRSGWYQFKPVSGARLYRFGQ
jgi:hypothetical protein